MEPGEELADCVANWFGKFRRELSTVMGSVQIALKQIVIGEWKGQNFGKVQSISDLFGKAAAFLSGFPCLFEAPDERHCVGEVAEAKDPQFIKIQITTHIDRLAKIAECS